MTVLFSMLDSSRDFNSHKTQRTTDLERKRFLNGWTFCLSLLVLVIFTGRSFTMPAAADPNEPREKDRQTELSERLEELIRRLRQERSAYYVQKARLEAQMEKARENRKLLQDELTELRRQETESDRQLQTYEAEVGGLKMQLSSKASLKKVLTEQVQPFLTSQRTEIEKGIPYKQEDRIARLEAVVGDVNTPGGISMADQLGHVWNYAQEELRLARSSDTYTARAQTDEESSPYARFFRVGQKILGYITEDGRQAAMWSSLARHKDWLLITNTEQSGQIRCAVEILDRRQGPRLVTLPVALEPADSQRGDSDASP